MKCKYCYYEIQGERHQDLCPYNPVNTKKILLFLKNYVLTKSKFNKNFKPFPRPRELDEFCRKNKIARLQTIAHRYLSPGDRINDWLVELLDYALFNNIVTSIEFPYFLQYIYDAWIFKSKEEYRRLYNESICYEDGFETTSVSSETIKLLRMSGKPFEEEKLTIDNFV